VTDVILECVCELPVKTSVYATLLALLNCERRDAVTAFLAHTQLVLKRALQLGPREATRARVLVRFLATCGAVRCVEPAASMAMLRSLAASSLAAAQDAGRPDGWQPRADALVYYALGALVFAGAELPDGDPEGLAALTALVEAYLGSREQRGIPPEARPLGGVGPDGEDDAAAGLVEDYLEELWGRVCVSQQSGSWEAASLRRARVHAPFRAHLAARCTPHDAPLLPDVPAIAPGLVPRSLAAAVAAFPPRPRLRALPRESTEGNDAGRMPIERFIAEELIADTLWAWEEGARTAGHLHMAAEQLAMGLPLDMPHAALLAETLFAHACALPAPRFRRVYYGVVLTDLCSLPAEVCNLAFSAPMARTIGACFRRMSSPGAVHPAAAESLAELLAGHLAATSLQWPWERWAAVAEQRRAAPQRRFVEDVLRRLLRLSYHARVAASLPAQLQPLLGSAPAPEAGWPYGGEAGVAPTPGAEADAARSLLALARAKAPAADMTAAALAVAQQLGGPTQALSVIGTVLFFHGRKSITHLSTMLTRYDATLNRLIASAGDAAAAGAALLRAAAAFWALRAGSEQGMTIATDRLLCLGLIPATAVVAWLFDDATRPLWPRGAPWAALECALEREVATAERSTTFAADAAAASADAAMAADAAMTAAEAASSAAETASSAAADAMLAAAAAHEAHAVRNSESMAEASMQAQPAADAAVETLQALVINIAERFSAAAVAAVEAAETTAAAAEAAGAPPRAADAAEEAMAQAVAVHDAFRSFAARYATHACSAAPQLAALLDAAPPPTLPMDAHALLPAPPPAPAPPPPQAEAEAAPEGDVAMIEPAAGATM